MTRFKHKDSATVADDSVAFTLNVREVANEVWRLYHSLRFFNPDGDPYLARPIEELKQQPGMVDAIGLVEALASYLSCVADDGRFNRDDTIDGLINHIRQLMDRHRKASGDRPSCCCLKLHLGPCCPGYVHSEDRDANITLQNCPSCRFETIEAAWDAHDRQCGCGLHRPVSVRCTVCNRKIGADYCDRFGRLVCSQECADKVEP